MLFKLYQSYFETHETILPLLLNARYADVQYTELLSFLPEDLPLIEFDPLLTTGMGMINLVLKGRRELIRIMSRGVGGMMMVVVVVEILTIL